MSNEPESNDSHNPPELAYCGDAPEFVQAGLEVAVRNMNENFHDIAYHVQEEESPVYQEPAEQASERRTFRNALHPLSLWLVVSLSMTILLAVGLGAGLGVKSNQNRQLLATCQQHLASQTGSNTAGTPSTASSGAEAASTTLASTCVEGETWISNLTRISYVQRCNAALTTDVQRTNVATAVVESFEACITMCDVFNYSSNDNMSFASWTNNGNSTNQSVRDPVGQCYCVSPATGYTIGEFVGKFSFLRSGTFKY